ncbi:MAG: hypothetical protein HUN04_11795 [Desulfobacter sp.]|nr:MAG: hypothetical protein HUN04_11795 [Desulfobacter sp.]
MQIDFHHAVTYVAARLAGFGHREAETVAYCAQYVDDATNSGTIKFNNNAMYSHISSAHKALDYKNFDALANHFVWIPFHFLPGNGGKRAGENPGGTFVEKIICRPDSPVAKEMVRACIREKDALYGLHRLGITMHVYADTWAHQGFAGITHEVNNISALDDQDTPDRGVLGKLKDFFGDAVDDVAGGFVGGVLPLGHGAALSYPDRPYLKWKYRDSKGNTVERDNSEIFSQAANQLCRAMQRYRAGDPDAEVPGLPEDDHDKISGLFRSIQDEDGETRHGQWLKKIGQGYFSFPPAKLAYRAKGPDSWKHQALGTRKIKDKKSDVFPYDPSFLGSDWKLFHDALQTHRLTVIRDILPRYGICAA